MAQAQNVMAKPQPLLQHFKNKYAPDGVNKNESSTFQVSNIAELTRSYGRFLLDGVAATRAQMIAMMPTIDILANNKIWFTVTPAEIFKQEDMDNKTVTDGYINLRWAILGRRDVRDVLGTTLQPFAIPGGVEIRFNVGDTLALAPSLTLWHWGEIASKEVIALAQRSPKPLTKTKSFNWAPDIIGENIYTYKNNGAGLKGITLLGANITRLEIRVDNMEWVFDSKFQLDDQLDDMGYTPAADTWHWVPERFIGEVLSIINMRRGGDKREVEMKIFTDSVVAINFFIEEYEVPAQNAFIAG